MSHVLPAPPSPTAAGSAPGPPGSATSVLGGAVLLSGTGMMVAGAGVGAVTASFWRCVLALVVLAPLALWEYRRRGAPSRAVLGWSAGAGVALGLDFLSWTQSVLDAGSGIANVLLNVQVLALPLLAWALTGQRVPRRHLVAAPLLLGGLAVAGGVLGGASDAAAPGRGAVLGLVAGLAYAAYLFASREGARRSEGRVFAVVAVATASAAATTGVAGAATGTIEVDLPAAAWGWLIALALVGQVLAWVLVGRGSAGLTAGTTGILLLAHPVLSVLLGMAVLGERPTMAQLGGVATVVVVVAAVTRRPRAPGAPDAPGASGVSVSAGAGRPKGGPGLPA